MVDRIEKLDPKHYQVQEAPQDRERKQQQPEEEEGKEQEKDEFDKAKPSLKRLIPETVMKSPVGARPRWKIPEEAPDAGEMKGEPSLTLSRRVLVLWGILDLEGKPRIPVIVTYLVVVTVITVSTFLILGILWR
jgi:hypothetical protein